MAIKLFETDPDPNPNFFVFRGYKSWPISPLLDELYVFSQDVFIGKRSFKYDFARLLIGSKVYELIESENLSIVSESIKQFGNFTYELNLVLDDYDIFHPESGKVIAVELRDY